MRTRISLWVALAILEINCFLYPKGYTPVKGIIPERHSESKCEKLYKEIEKKWLINTDLTEYYGQPVHCYYYQEKLVNKVLKHQECFKGLKRDAIIALFGKPNNEEKFNMLYFMSKKCNSDEYTPFFGDYTLNFGGSDTIVSLKLNVATPPH